MSDGFNIDDFIRDNIDSNTSTGNANPVPTDLTINGSPMPTMTNPTVQQQTTNPTVVTPGVIQGQPTVSNNVSTNVSANSVVAPGTPQNNVHFTSEQVAQNGTAEPRISQEDIVAGGVDNGNNNNNNGGQLTMAEKLKRVDVNYKPPSKFKIFLLVTFFILLIAFVLFLPNINSLVLRYKSGAFNSAEEKITTGKLECTLNTNTSNLDLEYKRVFSFTDSSLDSAEFTLTTKGDPTQDESTLNSENEKCEKLKDVTKSLNGINVSCEYLEGKLIERQSFNYLNLNPDEVDSAFAEAGGVNPEFSAGQDIDKIEKNMYAANYSCMRTK